MWQLQRMAAMAFDLRTPGRIRAKCTCPSTTPYLKWAACLRSSHHGTMASWTNQDPCQCRGHVHLYLKEVGQGVQHIASRVEDLPTLVAGWNLAPGKVCCWRNKGFWFSFGLGAYAFACWFYSCFAENYFDRFWALCGHLGHLISSIWREDSRLLCQVGSVCFGRIFCPVASRVEHAPSRCGMVLRCREPMTCERWLAPACRFCPSPDLTMAASLPGRSHSEGPLNRARSQGWQGYIFSAALQGWDEIRKVFSSMNTVVMKSSRTVLLRRGGRSPEYAGNVFAPPANHTQKIKSGCEQHIFGPSGPKKKGGQPENILPLLLRTLTRVPTWNFELISHLNLGFERILMNYISRYHNR